MSGADWVQRVALGVLALAVVAVGWAAWVWWSAERAIDRERLDAIEDRGGQPADPVSDDYEEILNVLVVGNDTREGLSFEERTELRTGHFDGSQTDTILLVQSRPSGMSIVSFPRDLKVEFGGEEPAKINSILEDHGRDGLVRLVEDILRVDIDHYVEVAIPSFLEIVDAAGGVEICLDEPLRDRKSGADFTAGCHQMDGPDALAYVRSRAGERSDFARVDRQQTFLRALVDRATSLAVLSNPLRVRDVVTEVSEGLTVDQELTTRRMAELANQLRGRLDEGLDATTLPAWPVEEHGIAYVVAYPPGVDAIADALRAGEDLPAHPSPAEREEVEVGIWAAGAPDEASVLESVLYFAGFEPLVRGRGPQVDVDRTTVLRVHGRDQEAEWVAGVLGAPIEEAPPGVELPEEVDVLVVAVERRQRADDSVAVGPAGG